jgi:superfamily II DNA or RNA helicase
MCITLRRWQKEAIDTFLSEEKGVVEASTGTGKTQVAIEVWREISSKHPDAMGFIVVPSTRLLDQWYDELRSQGFEVTRRGGGRKGNGFKALNVVVINTARELLPHLKLDNVLLIVDEAHRSLSPKNKQIFEMQHRWLLGLTATMPRSPGPFGKTIYEYHFKEAIEEGIINPVELFNVGYTMTPSERAEYDRFTNEKKKLERKLGVFSPSPELLNSIATKGETKEQRELAQKLRTLLFERKMALHTHDTRIELTKQLIEQVRAHGRRTLVIGQSIEACDKLAEDLSAFKEHSQMSNGDRVRNVNRFKDKKTDLLISAKTMREGIDIPHIDCVIIMSSPSGELQFIQSIGRGVRPEGFPWTAVYRVFARNTTDEMATANIIRSGVLDKEHIIVVNTNFEEIELSVPIEHLDMKARYQAGTKYSTSGPDFFRKLPRKGGGSGRQWYERNMKLYRLLREHGQWTGGNFVVEEDGTVLIKGKDKKYHEVGPIPEPLVESGRSGMRSLSTPMSSAQKEKMLKFFEQFSEED